MRAQLTITGAVAALLAAQWLSLPSVTYADKSVGQSFSVDLGSAGTSRHNVASTATGLRLPNPPAGGALQGFYVTPAYETAIPAARVRPVMAAVIPPGSAVMLEIRGQTASGRWTEWREATQGGHAVTLPRAVVRLQARITLEQHTRSGPGPEVQGLRLIVDPTPVKLARPTATPTPSPTPTATTTSSPTPTVTPKPTPRPMPTPTPTPTFTRPPADGVVTSRVFATRIGQIGDKTANGHTIRATDRFAALPSRRALNAGVRDRAYQVKICYAQTRRCATAPVWDVGPWNIKDDYWNPADVRQMWADLPQGRPQAQAAYQTGYNRGRDDRARRVRNAAGIDLADRLFWDDLGMTDNDWVMVTYLWTGDDEPLV